MPQCVLASSPVSFERKQRMRNESSQMLCWETGNSNSRGSSYVSHKQQQQGIKQETGCYDLNSQQNLTSYSYGEPDLYISSTAPLSASSQSLQQPELSYQQLGQPPVLLTRTNSGQLADSNIKYQYTVAIYTAICLVEKQQLVLKDH